MPVVQLLGVETLFHKSTARPQDDCVGDAMMPEKHVSCRSYRNLLKKIPEMETARPHFKHMQLPQGRSLSGIMRFQISSLLLLNVCSSSADLLDPLHTLVALRGSCSLGALSLAINGLSTLLKLRFARISWSFSLENPNNMASVCSGPKSP